MLDKSAINILVVDDEPLVLRLHTRMLANLGYAGVTACEGALHTLEKLNLEDTAPDLILLDLNMPDMDGVEFLRHLVKRDYRGSVILVSGEDERVLQAAEKLVHAHRITSLGHLRKPAKPAMLASLLEKWNPAARRNSSAAKKIYSANEVRAAVAQGELVNYYQPKVSLKTGQVAGAETLVRWRHPEDGIVFPDQFIGVAEANGLIRDLTRTMISGALADARSLQQESGLGFRVAVNVSADDLGSLEFVDYMAREAAATGVPANQIIVEVTESQLMQKDLRVPLEVLTRLRLKRFRVSIDDFGTGNSSLVQLRDMPFDELKIDRGFVHRAWTDDTVRAIFEATVTLARQLGMDIVAEGIEDRADWDFVCRSQCDIAQGYFIAKPMPFEALRQWVRDWRGVALLAA